MAKPLKKPKRFMEQAAQKLTGWTGSSWAFLLALSAVVGWVLCGPLFSYSDTWQLVINTSTTIVTFLMVFLIQKAQNKDSQAIQLKLNEVVAALQGASNRLIDAEDLSEDEIANLRKHYRHLAKIVRKDRQPTESHSIEEAACRAAMRAEIAKVELYRAEAGHSDAVVGEKAPA